MLLRGRVSVRQVEATKVQQWKTKKLQKHRQKSKEDRSLCETCTYHTVCRRLAEKASMVVRTIEGWIARKKNTQASLLMHGTCGMPVKEVVQVHCRLPWSSFGRLSIKPSLEIGGAAAGCGLPTKYRLPTNMCFP